MENKPCGRRCLQKTHLIKDLSKISQKILKVQLWKRKTWFKTWAKDLNWQLTQKGYGWQVIMWGFNILSHWGIADSDNEILLPPVGVTKFKTLAPSNARAELDKWDLSFVADGSARYTATLEDSLTVSYKTKYSPIALHGIYPQELKYTPTRKPAQECWQQLYSSLLKPRSDQGMFQLLNR